MTTLSYTSHKPPIRYYLVLVFVGGMAFVFLGGGDGVVEPVVRAFWQWGPRAPG